MCLLGRDSPGLYEPRSSCQSADNAAAVAGAAGGAGVRQCESCAECLMCTCAIGIHSDIVCCDCTRAASVPCAGVCWPLLLCAALHRLRRMYITTRSTHVRVYIRLYMESLSATSATSCYVASSSQTQMYCTQGMKLNSNKIIQRLPHRSLDDGQLQTLQRSSCTLRRLD